VGTQPRDGPHAVLLLLSDGRSARGGLRVAIGRGAIVACLCLGAGHASAQEAAELRSDLETLRSSLARIIEDPALERAHVGLMVQKAESGEVLFEHAAERRFIPASTTKLVTAAVAVAHLEPDFRWETRIVAAGPVSAGTLQGDLWVVGDGAPDLSVQELERIPDTLRGAGIERIDGDLIGDDRVFSGPQWGAGWMWDDLFGGSAAGVSGLQLSPNRISAVLEPGVLGEPATLVLPRGVPPLPIRTEVLTGAPGSETRIAFIPDPDDERVVLSGWIPAGAESVPMLLAPPHPTHYLLDRLAALLDAGGIEVSGRPRRASDGENPAAASWSTTIRSRPFEAVLAGLLKRSDNQIAETLLRTLGREAGDGGSAAEGLAVIESTLEAWGIEPGAIRLTDGSGLSRYNEIAPAALNRLLRRSRQLPGYDAFRAALPVGGVDGTLSRRFRGTEANRNVRAKTGSLSGVRGLAGFVTDGDGEIIVFTLLLNGYDVPGDVATALEDLLIEQLALYHGPDYPERRGSRP